MFRRHRQIKKLKKSIAWRDAEEQYYDKEGRAIINVGIQNADDIYSPFAYKTYELLNTEVSEYINICEGAIPFEDDVCIDFYTENPTTNVEKTRIRQTIKRHYAEQAVAADRQLRKNLIQGLLFVFLGVVILTLEAVFCLLDLSQLWLLLDVVGWLFLWDGIEIIIEDHSDLKREQLKAYRLMNAKVHVRQYDIKIKREYKLGEFEETEDEE